MNLQIHDKRSKFKILFNIWSQKYSGEIPIGSDLIYARSSLNPFKKVVSRNLKVGGKMFYIAPTTDRDGGGCVDITQSMVEAGLELVKDPFLIFFQDMCLWI